MAYPGNKKKEKKQPFFAYTNLDMKRVQWCLDKNIHVAVSPMSKFLYKIEIRLDKGQWNRDRQRRRHLRVYRRQSCAVHRAEIRWSVHIRHHGSGDDSVSG